MEVIQNGKKVIYVSQDNYYLANPIEQDTIYYCDSATSCIVLIAEGYSEKYKNDVALISHLSRPGRFDMYFSLVKDTFGTGKVKIFASGANPPEPCPKTGGGFDTTALRNATQVIGWLSSKEIDLDQVSLKLGQGNPAIYDNDLDCYSISFDSSNNMTVSNKRVYLTLEQRDPTLGVQTLFCIYGDENAIRDQKADFTENEKVGLVFRARKAGLHEAVDMSDEQILEKYSSTPDFEVPWFCDSIRQAAKYTLEYPN
ncbi:MAG: hypothetical protein K6G47_13700 [Clostridia bacterium]|nr:hypothetical protein [Clostridia bacterium]